MSAPVKFVGEATGIERYIPEFGFGTKTFVQMADNCLDYHVPLELRGDYRPNELANYNPEKDYRTDPFGKVLCISSRKDGAMCSKRATNRSFRCEVHGGKLHPLDKIYKGQDTSEKSRYQQFLAGDLDVNDLDDEELATCGFRAKDGRIYKPRKVPREMAQAFQKAIYERAQEELRALTIDAVHTMGEIMKSKTVEPDVRLKSALAVIERNLGKTPQAVVFSQDKPFEVVFDDISHERPKDIIDAEVVGERSNLVATDQLSDTAGESGYQALIAASEAPSSHDDDSADARLFERNEAVLAQTIEVKPFEYDLTDHTKEIKKATRKRYASRALGVDLTTPNYPYKRVEKSNGDGTSMVKHIDPKAKQDNVSGPKYSLADL